MNKEEYNKLNLIISYFAFILSLLVSNEDRKAMKNFLGHQLINKINCKLLKVRVLTAAVSHNIATILI